MNPAGLSGAAYWLPVVSAAAIALAVAMYVVRDGFDLGIGILFPYFPSETLRDQMMNSVAPFWNGNETWLVLGGTALFVAFPLACGVIMPALYVPVILTLLALVFRGVAFEFRWLAKPHHRRWDIAFAGGSTAAAFAQGLILGGILNGVPVAGDQFAGHVFGWLNAFSLMCGCGLTVGYALIGACWLVMKTTAEAEQRATLRTAAARRAALVHRAGERVDSSRVSPRGAALVQLAEPLVLLTRAAGNRGAVRELLAGIDRAPPVARLLQRRGPVSRGLHRARDLHHPVSRSPLDHRMAGRGRAELPTLHPLGDGGADPDDSGLHGVRVPHLPRHGAARAGLPLEEPVKGRMS